jgi:hypothetical protein
MSRIWSPCRNVVAKVVRVAELIVEDVGTVAQKGSVPTVGRYEFRLVVRLIVRLVIIFVTLLRPVRGFRMIYQNAEKAGYVRPPEVYRRCPTVGTNV